jgi:CubicO group peptidase (beta-lactamase class C family)
MLNATLENWRISPHSRWGFQNVDRLIPTARICPDSAAEPDAGAGPLLQLDVDDADGRRIKLTEYLQRTSGDALIAMRDGTVIAEWYAAHADRARPHTIFSISKSVTGMLAGIAAGEGKLDPDAPIARYVGVAADSAYAKARVRHLLDMSVAIDFEENYLDQDGVFERYRRAMLWNPDKPGKGSETLEGLITTLPAGAGEHGRKFLYVSPNADLLGLVIERATGVRYHEYLADRLWKPMGARGGAHVTVDRAGAPRSSGGICATARDLARFGQLVLDDGRSRDGTTVIPAAWIADMRCNGDRAAWRDGTSAGMFANGRYRSGWYQTGNAHDAFCAVGIHAQWLWIDPARRLILAKLSSRPAPSNDAATALEKSVLNSLAQLL